MIDRHEQPANKPEGVTELEDALLVAIMLFSVVTWVAVLMRLLTAG